MIKLRAKRAPSLGGSGGALCAPPGIPGIDEKGGLSTGALVLLFYCFTVFSVVTH